MQWFQYNITVATNQLPVTMTAEILLDKQPECLFVGVLGIINIQGISDHDMYRLLMANVHGDLIVLPNWETRPLIR